MGESQRLALWSSGWSLECAAARCSAADMRAAETAGRKVARFSAAGEEEGRGPEVLLAFGGPGGEELLAAGFGGEMMGWVGTMLCTTLGAVGVLRTKGAIGAALGAAVGVEEGSVGTMPSLLLRWASLACSFFRRWICDWKSRRSAWRCFCSCTTPHANVGRELLAASSRRSVVLRQGSACCQWRKVLVGGVVDQYSASK